MFSAKVAMIRRMQRQGQIIRTSNNRLKICLASMSANMLSEFRVPSSEFCISV